MQKNKKYKLAKRVLVTIIVIVTLIVSLILFIRSKWGQQIIVEKAITYLSEKTNTKINIDKLYLTFSGNLLMKGFYIEDQKKDTLLYSKKLEASIGIIPLVQGKSLNLKSLDWSGVVAKISKENGAKNYNYDFLIDAFSSNTDTISSPPTSDSFKISLGTITLNSIKLNFNDKESGMQSFLNLGSLHTNIQNFDLDEMRFELNDFNISNTNIVYKQNKSIVEKQSLQETILPYIKAKNINFNNIILSYVSEPEKQDLYTKLNKVQIQSSELDLNQKNISVSSFLIENSTINFKDLKESENNKDKISKNNNPEFKWPDWKLKINEIVLENNQISYTSSNKPVQKNVFDPKSIALTDLDIKLLDIYLEPDNFTINVNNVSFRDRSGFSLRQFNAKLKATNSFLTITDLKVKTNQSSILGNLNADFTTIHDFINTPGKSRVKLSLSKIQASVKDAYFFQPSLKENLYIQTLSEKEIKGSLFANGQINNISFDRSFLQWGDATKMSLDGNIKNVTIPDSISFDVTKAFVNTHRKDLIRFISEKQLSIKIPDSVSLHAKGRGTLQSILGNAQLSTSLGDILVNGTFKNQKSINFDGTIDVKTLRLDQILSNKELGAVSFTADISGSGTSVNTLNASLQSNFQKLDIKGYDFSALHLNANIKNGIGQLKADFKDQNLNLNAIADIQLDTITPKFDMKANIIGADLYKLGITKKSIKTKFDLHTIFEGSSEEFTLKTDVSNATFVYQNEPYTLQNVNLDILTNNKKTNLTIKSGFLNGKLFANAGINPVMNAVEKHFANYLVVKDIDTIQSSPVKMELNLSFKETSVLSDVLTEGLKNSDTISLYAKFDESNHTISAHIKAPNITYNQSSLDNFRVNIDGSEKKIGFTMGWDSIKSSPIAINKTKFAGTLSNQKLRLNFDSFDKKESPIAHVVSELEIAKDTLYFHVDPVSLILDKTPWKIHKNNSIIIADKHIFFKDFTIKKNEQEININSERPDIKKNHVNIDFKKFKLSHFTNFLNETQLLVAGEINGDICIEEPFGKTGILADLSIQNLAVTEIPLGDITLKAKSKEYASYDFDLKLKGNPIDMYLQGDYIASKEGAKIDLDFVLNKLDMKTVESFAKKHISNTTGTLSGKAKIKGSITAPKYNSSFNFNNTGAIINTLNTKFIFPEETINIDNKGISINQFTIEDENKNKFTIDGKIKTETLSNPIFDLSLKANNFRIINASKEDNDLFFGKVNINTNLSIKGDLVVPKIRGNINIEENSDITFIIPESELEIKEQEGVVIFVNRENPDAILTRVEKNKSDFSFLRGFDIDTRLNVGKQSLFKIIIDERNNDFLQVSGEGDFLFGMEPNGRTTLTGQYKIKDGKYKVSLYDLVSREFDIAPGGTITWKGDPLEAELDVRAIYTLETSASALMASKTSSKSAENFSNYSRNMPFLVYLNVNGELLSPKISFALDMPEDEQGLLGGSVYSRIQQLNNQEEERNKQVFSLLVLNRFFPESGNDGSNGGVASLARDNVNKVLAGQLNNFTDKIIGKSNLDLNFGLNSYSSYEGDSYDTKTELEINAQKKFMNNRLIAQVGSTVNVEGNSQTTEEVSPIIGNVSLEYLLSENGRYRLKGFRKNEFESVIDGQLIVTGIAFIFNREFNQFKELWSSSVRKELKKREQERKGKQNNKKDN
ncbi:translocation/assembly module TamB domain-containing protein [Aquimarina muelleri]|uniref:translocation/assembly module TamB domain-containing protein n=1 Tax=Aquimarina muelleri TaxID=279356 RepID=UPI003F686D02